MSAVKRILVADDDRAIRRLVATVVARQGIEVDTAEDGAAAIECLSKNDYALILLDLMMPEVDGFAVIDYLAANPRPKKPVVLVVSAYADQTFRTFDPDVVSGVIRKPFDIVELGEAIRTGVAGVEIGDDTLPMNKERE